MNNRGGSLTTSGIIVAPPANSLVVNAPRLVINPHVKQAIEVIRMMAGPGSVIELRAFGVGRSASHAGHITSGYFEVDNAEALTRAILSLDGKCEAIYSTLNRINPELLQRARNRLQVRPKYTTSDADIVARLWLFIDIDPIRPSGISATAEEHAAALAAAEQIADYLSGLGWPDALIVDSGNGFQIFLRLPPMDLALGDDLVRRALQALADRFDTESVKVDLVVGNRSRIVKLPGSLVRKGDSAPQRPHRRACCYRVPEHLDAVPIELLEQLASEAPTPTRPTPVSINSARPANSQFSLDDFLARHKVEVGKGPAPYNGGLKWTLRTCPFNGDHQQPGPAVIQLAGGALVFKCQHASCSANNWKTFRAHYEPERPRRALHETPATEAPRPTTRSPGEPPPGLIRFPLTDLGNAEYFVQLHGKHVRYCHPWKKFLVWGGQRWLIDATAEITRRAKTTTRRMFTDGARVSEPDLRDKILKHARATEKHARLSAMIDLAAAETGIPVLPESLDSDPWLLNVANGTLDLRTGKLMAFDPDQLITKLAPTFYDPDAPCPTWLAFQNRIMNGNEELIRFKQRVLGYALTGIATEKRAFIIYSGTGNNGKTTELELCRDILGEYAGQVRVESLLEQKHKDGNAASPDIADLRGLRFVIASEPPAGRPLAEATIKYLTGMGTIKARHLHKDNFEFKQTWKIFMDCNKKPPIKGTENAIWNRIGLVPFDVEIPEEEIDTELPGRLRSEAPGILAWMVRGCLAWQRDGLGLADAVRVATSDYRSEMDILGRFIGECCIIGPYATARGKNLYKRFQMWCEEAGEAKEVVTTMMTFGLQLTERGYAKAHDNEGVKYTGIGLGTREAT